MNVFNNVILTRNRQDPDDDRMIETCRSIFKSFNVNNLSVCIGWCTDQVTGYNNNNNEMLYILDLFATILEVLVKQTRLKRNGCVLKLRGPEIVQSV